VNWHATPLLAQRAGIGDGVVTPLGENTDRRSDQRQYGSAETLAFVYAECEWLRFLKLVGHIAVKFDAERVGSNSVSI
jgi:hypothetical protein